MGYSAEVVRRARERLAQAREDRESENRQHLQEAYTKVPRLKEIDLQLRRTMAMAAQAAFVSGSDAQEALARAREENMALQRERQALAAEYFEEGYLDDSPICDCCGGLGYVGSTMCECLTELCRQEQKKELSLLAGGKESFSQFRLDYYSDRVDPHIGMSHRQIMERNFRTCRTYAATFSLNADSLLFSGDTGLGKTFLSACIARVVADRGYSVTYETASRLFNKLERAKFSNDEEARKDIQKYNACDLLIIDDLGTEMPSQFVTAALYSIINDRILESKPMIISTNLTVDDMKLRYSSQIESRLRGCFKRIAFVGTDIRVLKSKGL